MDFCGTNYSSYFLPSDKVFFHDEYSGIDYAVTHNDVPSKVHDLPSVIKQVI